jgi:hypothetical protein
VSSSPPALARITFSSVPVTAADEGALYSYQLTATSSDGSAVNFSLSQAPEGASLSGGNISWTPAHAQARSANQFTVSASTASGGAAQQTWSVSPNGVVVISAILTYWTPSGSIDEPTPFLADQPFPAAILVLADGQTVRLQGATNPDGTFSIPHVPPGYYWLQFAPTASFWTSTSTFDAGRDFIGNPLRTTNQAVTTLDVSLTPPSPVVDHDLFAISGNLIDFPDALVLYPAFSGPVKFSLPINGNIDLSSLNTLFFRQYHSVATGGFTGNVLSSALTESNLKITNGTVNAVGGSLLSPPSSNVQLNIKGSEWVNTLQNAAPSPVTEVATSFDVSVQPFLKTHVATIPGPPASPNLTLLSWTGNNSGSGFVLLSLISGSCRNYPAGQNSFARFGPDPIVSDQDFGSISFGDPYPSDWLRTFDYCQIGGVQIPRPNSTVTDTFIISSGQTTALPTGTVSPVIGPVQSPMLNGVSLFQVSILNTSAVKLSWSPPNGVAPVGYSVQVFQYLPGATTLLTYAPAGTYYTAKNSIDVPFLVAGNSYIFQITAHVNAGANFENSPFRSDLPVAHSTVISNSITLSAGSSANSLGSTKH